MSKGALSESASNERQFTKLSILHLHYISLYTFRMRFSCGGLLYRF